MAKTNYFVTLPDGSIDTRSSARVYTHAVVIAHDEAGDIARLRREAERCREYAAKYSAPGWAEASAAEAVAKFPTLNLDYEEEVAERRGWAVSNAANAERMDAEANALTPGKLHYYVTGWCGRYDLAVKLAASSAGPFRTATIVEAQVR